MSGLVIAILIGIIAYAIVSVRASSGVRTTGEAAPAELEAGHHGALVSGVRASDRKPRPRARHLLDIKPRLNVHPPTPFPAWWLAQATCLHDHEGSWDAETGNGYSGGLQFTQYTWNRALRLLGAPYRPRASMETPRHQLEAAWAIWWDDDRSFREWGTAGSCGLR